MTSQLHKKGEAWSARFSEPMSELVKRYTSSVFFDKRLALVDIAGSLAHAKMLAAQKIISADDLAAIERGMAQIKGEIERGEFEWQRRPGRRAPEHRGAPDRPLIGDAGKRLHTGRSRNDQVATDIRLWLRGEIDRIGELLDELRRALLALAEQHADTIMPGFTHLQVAQPVTFGHHLLAYVEMFTRDDGPHGRLPHARQPPAAGRGRAGRHQLPDRPPRGGLPLLGFDGICANSLDAVSDRDFAIEFTAAASAGDDAPVALLGRAGAVDEPARRQFIDLADRFCTGSSIMPQKKNPDVPELARGKTGRVNGHLMALLTLMKGQPLAYNKDNQEDKEPLFDTVDTLRGHAAHLRRDGGRHHGQGRGHARGRPAGLLDRHRPGRLPGQARPAVPRLRTKRSRTR